MTPQEEREAAIRANAEAGLGVVREEAAAARPSEQGWSNRRPRITWTLVIGLVGFLVWTVGIAGALIVGNAVAWPLVAAGLIPTFLALYPLDLYVRVARGERADLFDRAARHLEAVGNAIAVARGNAPIPPNVGGQGER